MTNRFLDIFWPSKGRAFVAMVGGGVIGVLFFTNPALSLFGLAALIYAAWYALVWLCKAGQHKQAAKAHTKTYQAVAVPGPARSSARSRTVAVPQRHPNE